MPGRKAPKRVGVVLFYPSEEVAERWVAHCLDWDIVGTGDTPADAFLELLRLLELQIETWYELGDDAVFPERAPKVYWNALKQAIELPPFDINGLLKRIVDRRTGRHKFFERCRGALVAKKRGKGADSVLKRKNPDAKGYLTYPFGYHREYGHDYINPARRHLKLRPEDGVSDEDFYGA